jgi:hypothetical protein
MFNNNINSNGISDIQENSTVIHDHCLNCFTFLNCKNKSECDIISCRNNCGAKYHTCKDVYHLNEICSQQNVPCLNKVNGCRLEIKRHLMYKHLISCPASVVQCTAYSTRKIINKNKKFKTLKWDDPIDLQKRSLALTISQHDLQTNSNGDNINKILLKKDLETLRKFSVENPLKFHRMYGYLIGLDVSKDYSQSRFSFMRKLLNNVKSKIFKDIQTENCIVFNDEVGCSACQRRTRNRENERFEILKADRFGFNSVLRGISNLT